MKSVFNMKSKVVPIRCIHPFEEIKCSKEIRKLSDSTIQKLKSIGYSKASELNSESRICSSCRLYTDKLALSIPDPELEPCIAGSSKMVPTAILPDVRSAESLTTVSSATTVPSVPSINEFAQPVNVEIFNRGIAGIQVSPIDLEKLSYTYYPDKKCREINQGVRRNLFQLEPEVGEAVEFDEVIQNMKQRFLDPITTRSEQLLILSMLPKSWPIQRLIDQFGATRYMATEAKGINDKGESSKARVSGIALSNETKKVVEIFFEEDEISRAMPGQKDFVSVKKDGKRQVIQKRLLMMTLRETYKCFKNQYKDVKIGFSAFANLRPKQCKLLTNIGTHNVCVCTTHENIKLILHSLRKYNISNDLKMYTDSLLCTNKTKQCHLRRCQDCPDSSALENKILEQLEEKCIEQLSFEQWVTTDRCDLETIVKSADEFVPFFCSKLGGWIPHDFIKTEQSTFLKNTKNSLQDGEFLAILDFSENYSFVLQDEVQSHHWNVQQATIHPFVIYYKQNTQVEHFSFIIISEELRHDSVAVNLFISKMMHFLRVNQHKKVNKMYFMSDGAASQYKNRKNFSSICKFKSKYGIEAEWHFFATSHGKGPCDAIGGTLKRMATRASLAKEREHPIKNAKELFDWANHRKEEELTKLFFDFATTDEYESMASELNEQYNNAKTIQGTQKFHSFIPLSESKIIAKPYSNCAEEDAKIFEIVKKSSRK